MRLIITTKGATINIATIAFFEAPRPTNTDGMEIVATLTVSPSFPPIILADGMNEEEADALRLALGVFLLGADSITPFTITDRHGRLCQCFDRFDIGEFLSSGKTVAA